MTDVVCLCQLNVQMIVSGKLRHVDKGVRSYQLYLDHLFKVLIIQPVG